MRYIAWVALLLIPAGFGYVREVTGTATPVPLVRVDNTAIQFYMNSLIVPGVQTSASGSGVTVISGDSDPQTAVHKALAAWNAVSTANVNFLPLKLTTAVINPNDFQATIAIGSTPSDLSAVGGALAITVDSYVLGPSNPGPNGGLVVCSSNCTYPVAGSITDSDIILNPADSFSTTGAAGTFDFQATITHELGHSLSANHTSLLGGTMYPYISGIIARYLSTDDLAFVNSVYPATAGPAPFGTISGTITTAGNVGVSYGMITMIDISFGNTIGGLTNPDGTFSVQVPPGTYVVYAEPYNPFMQPGNFYLTTSQAALVSTFQSTMYGGSASPTPVTVTANATATVNIAVTAGATSLKMQYYAFGGAGKSGDIRSVNSLAPIQVPSGASIDFAFIGTGLDATLTDANFRVYGQGISVHPGTVRVDKSVNFPQGPLIRATLDIPARTSDTLASIFINTASGTLSLSAILTVTPPTPTTTSQSVVSSASGLGNGSGNGAVSPGGIYTIYSIQGGAPNLGPGGADPTKYVQNGPFDAYGTLATSLAGVTVTFDGIPAPIFLSWGYQLNVQVPFEVAGKKSTQVVINYLGSTSAPVTVPVLPLQPALFVSCGGVCAVNLSASGSYNGINSAQNPAPAGSYVEVFGTGIGVLSYTFATGQGAPAPPAGFQSTYTYTIGGSPAAPAAFAGWAYGTAGEAQWNLLIPAGIGTGAVSIAVTDTVTGASSQPGAKIYVK